MPRDIQEDSRSYIHPDRINQVGKTLLDLSGEQLSESEPSQLRLVIEKAEQFLQVSRKERKTFNKQKEKDRLSRMRSGKVIAKPLSNKQRNYLQSIPKDTISAYLVDRK